MARTCMKELVHCRPVRDEASGMMQGDLYPIRAGKSCYVSGQANPSIGEGFSDAAGDGPVSSAMAPEQVVNREAYPKTGSHHPKFWRKRTGDEKFATSTESQALGKSVRCEKERK